MSTKKVSYRYTDEDFRALESIKDKLLDVKFVANDTDAVRLSLNICSSLTENEILKKAKEFFNREK